MQSGCLKPQPLRLTPLQRSVLGRRPAPLQQRSLRGLSIRRGLANDVAGGFLDLAKLVSSGGSSQKTPYDELASKLGALPAGLSVPPERDLLHYYPHKLEI